jgi:hypothetical protein
MQPLATSQKIGQGLVMTNVKHEINIFRVLEVAIESDDVLMAHRVVNFDFTCEFLSGLGTL